MPPRRSHLSSRVEECRPRVFCTEFAMHGRTWRVITVADKPRANVPPTRCYNGVVGFRVDREQALVLGGRYLRALIAGAAAATHELGESRTGVEPRLAQPTPLALGRPHGRLGTVAGAAVYGGFVAAIVCLALVVLNV